MRCGDRPTATAIAGIIQSDTILRVIFRYLRSRLHRVLNLSFLAAISLLLFIGLGCLWEWPTRVSNQLTYTRSSGQSVKPGMVPRRFYLFLEIPWAIPRNDPSGWSCTSKQWDPEQLPEFWPTMWRDSWLGFNLFCQARRHDNGGHHIVRATIPLWFPMVLALITPVCWLRRWRRQARRVRLGLCLHCGYDLRVTPDSTGPRLPRCPECGHES